MAVIGELPSTELFFESLRFVLAFHHYLYAYVCCNTAMMNASLFSLPAKITEDQSSPVLRSCCALAYPQLNGAPSGRLAILHRATSLLPVFCISLIETSKAGRIGVFYNVLNYSIIC